ncbi:hypothetical protein GALMADRAFT_258083 [Galerina marginata CBS 339.88]|uniref:Uncharacterized protein n=1 Tax=Galerina marginata (strain CBS 339.88) TaxID=685588 RepID=A0A067S9I6_GALM3|nr:hypothetical protein GALMADRAFT_258083 [Galerina marginata CBS 339.88]
MSAKPSKQWAKTGTTFERLFGDSEAAFYPGSKVGLGDMFLHLDFRAPQPAVLRERVTIAWAIIRRRHPVLMCRVIYDSAIGIPYFSFTPPANSLMEAGDALSFNNKSKDELIFEYMNGRRTLSDEHLSHLVISASHLAPTSSTPSGASDEDFTLFLCAPHFLGDGISLHQTAHDLLSLLASPLTNSQLEEELNRDIEWTDLLPPSFETRLDAPTSSLAKIACKVDFIKTLGKDIGGHTLPRKQRGSPQTVIYEAAFSEDDTALILRKCKANNVTVNHALIALCNLVWARNVSDPRLKENPMMMYTAINLRPHLTGSLHPSNTYWFMALTYSNIVLPGFVPGTPQVFWHRARSVKHQLTRVIRSPLLKSRALEMAQMRVARSRGEVVDLPTLDNSSELSLPPAPSAALLGVSLPGNLDATYDRSSYPSFHLHSVTAASRMKAGGLLLIGHTFAKKLCLQLCWDENGFEEGHIERFWRGLQDAVHQSFI